MNNIRNAHERLDALLSALEDEVMSGEGILVTDVEEMRAEIEDLIMQHAGSGVCNDAASTGIGEDANDKKAFARVLMGRLAEIGQAVHSNSLPRVRMAFSGKRDLPDDVERTESRSYSDSEKNK